MSHSIAIGHRCFGASRADTGLALTLGEPLSGNNVFAQRLLSLGYTARHTLVELLANDSHAERRQMAIIDREGAAAVHTGAGLRPWAGHRIRNDYALLGDMLAAEDVLDAMTSAFERDPAADLDARLLATIEAARDAGTRMNESGGIADRSVALIVQGANPYTEIDLRVDLHDQPVAELRRLYDEYRPYASYYDDRGRNPRNAIPQREFADILHKMKSRA